MARRVEAVAAELTAMRAQQAEFLRLRSRLDRMQACPASMPLHVFLSVQAAQVKMAPAAASDFSSPSRQSVTCCQDLCGRVCIRTAWQ